MATQDDSVLGTEDQKSEWILDTVTDFVWNLWEAISESPIGEFFADDDATKLEESKILKQEWIDSAQSLGEDTISDSLWDLWRAGKWFITSTFFSDIEDQEAFDQMQELNKTYNDQAAPIIKQLNDMEAEGIPDKAEYNRLIVLHQDLQKTYVEQEASLMNRAMKWDTLEEKRLNLKNLYENSTEDWDLSNETALVMKYSQETDEYLNGLSREYAEYRGFEDMEFAPSITRLKSSFASELTNWKVNRNKTIKKMKGLWFSQAEIEDKIKLFIEQEGLYKELVEASLSAAYAWVSWEDMTGVIVDAMWEEKSNRLIELERNLTLNEQLQSWIQGLQTWHIASWLINTLAAGISKATWATTELYRDVRGLTTEELLAKDFTEVVNFDQTWLKKWLTWGILNTDDVIANTVGVVAWGWLTTVPFKAAARAWTHTNFYINHLNKLAPKNKTLQYLLYKGNFSVKNLTENVAAWLIPNAIINTAAHDVTSEARILFDAVMDLTMWPILDKLVITPFQHIWGRVKWLTKTIQNLGWLIRSDLVKAIKDTYWMSTSNAEELLDTYSLWKSLTGKGEIKSDQEAIDFVKANKALIEESEWGVKHADWITAKLVEDIEMIGKHDTWVSSNLARIARDKDIDLSVSSIETNQAERIFKTIKAVDTEVDTSTFLTDTLGQLGVNKKDIEANKAELIDIIGEPMLNAAKKAQEGIKKLEESNVITKSDINILNDITDYYNNLNQLAQRFARSRTKVYLYDSAWNEVQVDISDIENKGYRVFRKSDKEELFQTTSIMNKLKNREYAGYEAEYNVNEFVRRGDWVLNESDLENAKSLITKITWVTPKVINKDELGSSKDLINIYKDPDTGRFHIYVWGKFLNDFKAPNKKIKIELSWDKYKKAIKERKKIFNKKQDYNLTEKVLFNKEAVTTGVLNRTIWNRVLLSNKVTDTWDIIDFTADRFEDLISSEVINLKKIASGHTNVLRQWVTIKAINEIKPMVISSLKKLLTPELNAREQKEFFKLLDDTVFSIGWLNLLSKFSRAIWGKDDKINVMANLMESLALHSAFRYKKLGLSDNLINRLAKIADVEWKTTEARTIVTRLLLGEDPINAMKFAWEVKWGVKHLMSRIEKEVWIDISNQLIKHTDEDLNKFLEWLLRSKQYKWEVDDATLAITAANDSKRLTNRVVAARDTYIHSVVKEIYKWDKSVYSILNDLRLNKWMKAWDLTDQEKESTLIFMRDIENAKTFEEVETILNEQKDQIKLLTPQLKRVNDIISQFNKDQVSNIDNALSMFIETNSRLDKAIRDNLSKRINEWVNEHTIFYVEDFYTWDNIVKKSLDHILNPYTKSLVYDEDLAREAAELIDTKILKGITDTPLYDIVKGLRDDTLSIEEKDRLKSEFETVQEAIEVFVNPELKTRFKKLSSKTLKQVRSTLKERNDILRDIYDSLYTYVWKETDRYTVVNKKGEALSQEDIQKELFSHKAKFQDWKILLGSLQNKVRYGYFNGYKLDLWNKTLLKNDWFTEEKTFFNRLTGRLEDKTGISDDNISFKPILVEWQLYEFFKQDRGQHIELQNLYKYIKDARYVEGESWDSLINKFKKLAQEEMEWRGYDDFTIDQVAREFWLSDELYVYSLNIWDKDWLGVWFVADKEFVKWLNLEWITAKIRQEFAVRHKNDYKYTGKDRASGTIGKRISVQTHEDTTMSPGVELKMLDIAVEELSTVATYLSKNRYDDLKVFTDKEEEIIDNIISKRQPTIQEMETVVNIYENKVPDTSLKGMKQIWDDRDWLTKSKYDHINTANSDWFSEQWRNVHELMIYYQGYIKEWDPAKYHYAELWADMAKTSWLPYSKDVEDSVSKELWGFLKKNNFEVWSTRLIWIESKKLWGKGYLVSKTDKYIEDWNWVKRKVLWYKKSNTKYNRPASEETYTEWAEVNGITKQVASQTHPLAKRLISDYETKAIEDLSRELNEQLGTDLTLPISTRSEYGDFLNSLNNELELQVLEDSKRKYIQWRFNKLLKEFEKPKADWLWYRSVFVPRSTYRNVEGKNVLTKDSDIYISKEQYKHLQKISGTIEIDWELYVTTYRSPVPNTENVTLHKLVIDYSMTSQDVVAVSPFVANVLKQADFDWDHLNIVFIKKWVHSWGIASALGFLLNRDIPEEQLDALIKTVYNKDIPYQEKEDAVFDYIKTYVSENPDISMPSVSVKQIKPNKSLTLDETTLYGENLPKAVNTIYNDWLAEDWKSITYQGKTFKIWEADKKVKFVFTKDWEPILKTSELADKGTYNEKQIKDFIESDIRIRISETEIGKSLYEANSNAIVWKDNISLVAASTRTYTILRDLAWEYHRGLIDNEELAKLLSLKESDPVFTEILIIFDWLKNKLDDKTYAAESASINQMTVDAAKTGKLPEDWEETLRMVALWTEEVSDNVKDYLSNVSQSYNKLYQETDLFNFLQQYDYKSKKTLNTEELEKGKRLIWNNVYIRDLIRKKWEEFDPKLAKWSDSYRTWLTDIKWIWSLKNTKGENERRNLRDTLKQLINKEDQWLVDLVLDNKVTHTVKKFIVWSHWVPEVKEWKLSKWKDKWKIIKQSNYPSHLKYAEPYRIHNKTSEIPVISGDTLQEVLEIDWVKTIRGKFPNEAKYTPDDFNYFFSKQKGEYVMGRKHEKYESKPIKTEGDLLTIAHKGKINRKAKDQLTKILVNKLNDNNATIKIDDKELVFTKEELVKILHAHTGSKLPSEYLDYILAQQIFPSSVLNKKTSEERLLSGLKNTKNILIDNIDSDKVNKELKQEFKDILESVEDLGEIKELELGDNFIQIKYSDKVADYSWDYEINGRLYNFDTKGNEVIVTQADSDQEFLNKIVISKDYKDNTINEFKTPILEADVKLEEVLWVKRADIRDKEEKLNVLLEETTKYANVINSDLAIKYFPEEMIRTSHLVRKFPKIKHLGLWAYDTLSGLRKQFDKVPDHVKRKIDNLIYFINHGWMDPKKLDRFSSPEEEKYKAAMVEFYNRFLSKYVVEQKINIPRKYTTWSIIEDITWLETGKTLKVPFLEKEIFKKDQFDNYAKEKMGNEYHEVEIKWGKTKYSRRVDDLYGWIFELNVLDENSWFKGIKTIRNAAYQVIYGWLSWFTTMGWLLVWASQIPTEFLRIQSMTNKIKGLHDNNALNVIQKDLWILQAEWFSTAARVWPQELKAPVIQSWLYKILNNLGTTVWLQSNEAYQSFIRGFAGIGWNPMLITDAVIDWSRKAWAIADTLYMLGFNNAKDFIDYTRSLTWTARDNFLAKTNLAATKMYHDLSGWVTSSSYLYRESYFSRRMSFLPFSFLMGWSNRIVASAVEDGWIAMRGFWKMLSWNFQKGFDMVFNKSKALEKLVSNTVLSVGIYSKIYSHDDYEGEFAKRKSISEWITAMNSNFIAIGMFLPTKVIKAGVEWEEGFDVRAVNMLHQTLSSTFRELDIAEMATENMEDWLKGDRDSIVDAILSAVNERAMKWLLYNKVLTTETLYSEFRDRQDIESMLWIWMKSLDEEIYFDLHKKNTDLYYEALMEDNRHDLVMLEIIKAAPFLWLLMWEDSFGSYEVYLREHKPFMDYLASQEFNETFLDIDAALLQIDQGQHINNLFQSLATPLKLQTKTKDWKTVWLDPQLKAKLNTELANLNEEMIVDQLKKKYGEDTYARMVLWVEDQWLDFINTILTESQATTNQLLIKIQSESPAAAPYILAQILKSEMNEIKKAYKSQRGIYWTESPMTEAEQDIYQKALIRKYEPLIRASNLTENQLATYLAISARPGLLNTVLTDSWYIKDTVADRVAMQLAVSKATARGEANPGYLTTRLGGITNKLERALQNNEITESTFKAKMLDLFNYGLDNINNSLLSTDQKVEMKTAMIKSLGEHAYVLNEDPSLAKWFDNARVNLMHKLFDTTMDLKPYAEQAKIDLAEQTGRISKWTSTYLRSGKNYNKPFARRMGDQIPKIRNMLADPRNWFRNAFQPGKSGYNPSTRYRPLNSSFNRVDSGIREYRKFLTEQKSLGIIKPMKKYKAKPRYIKVGRAETIKVAVQKKLKQIYWKQSKGLLKWLPYNR